MAPPNQSGPNRMPLAECKPTRSVLLDTKPTGAKMVRCSECHSYFNLGNNYSVKFVSRQAVKDALVCGQPEKEAQCGMENKPKSRMTVDTLTLKCKMCAKVFRDSLSQLSGIVSHSVQDRLCCAGCVPQPAVPLTVVAHKRELRPEDAHFLCSQCARRLGMCHRNQTSKPPVWIVDQLRTNSPPGVHRSSFKCQNCGMVLRSKRRLEVHERKHNLHFTCQTCGQRFSQFKALYCHLRVHATRRPHLCHFCGQLFREPQAYQVHMRKEEEENKLTNPSNSTPHPRDVRSTYQNCVNRHAVKQPHMCRLCEMQFERESLYQLHLEKVHGEKDKPSSSSEAPQLREVRRTYQHYMKRSSFPVHVFLCSSIIRVASITVIARIQNMEKLTERITFIPLF